MFNNIKVDVWHIDEMAPHKGDWLVESVKLDTAMNPVQLGDVIAGNPVQIIQESKTTDPNVILFICKNTNIRYIAVWGNTASRFAHHFAATKGDFDDGISEIFKKFNVKMKTGAENDLDDILTKLYDITYKKVLESYDGEKDQLLKKFKTITGREKPGFMI